MPKALLNQGPHRIPTSIPLRLPGGPASSSGDIMGPRVHFDLGSRLSAELGDEASGLSREALEEGGASLLAGGGIAGSVGTFESAAAALSSLAPIGVVATDLGGLAIGAIDAFGGDVSISTYATTPQLDATTALGRAAAAAQAPLIRQSLKESGSKFAFKGALDAYDFATEGGF